MLSRELGYLYEVDCRPSRQPALSTQISHTPPPTGQRHASSNGYMHLAHLLADEHDPTDDHFPALTIRDNDRSTVVSKHHAHPLKLQSRIEFMSSTVAWKGLCLAS
jgi:hypothetical protein